MNHSNSAHNKGPFLSSKYYSIITAYYCNRQPTNSHFKLQYICYFVSKNSFFISNQTCVSNGWTIAIRNSQYQTQVAKGVFALQDSNRSYNSIILNKSNGHENPIKNVVSSFLSLHSGWRIIEQQKNCLSEKTDSLSSVSL